MARNARLIKVCNLLSASVPVNSHSSAVNLMPSLFYL